MAELKDIKVGREIEGEVVKVTQNQVLVDCGYITEGTIHIEHLTTKKISSCGELVKVGDKIRAVIKKVSDGDTNPLLLLSCIEIENKEKHYEAIREIRKKEPFEAKVKKVVKEGLLLDYKTVELLLPEKLIDLEEIDKNTLLGKTVKVKYVAENRENRNITIIVDRKSVQYFERKEAKDAEFNQINVGDVLKGEVVRVTNYGAFVKFNHNEGLIPFTELSHYHLKSVEEAVKVGDEVEVKVIKKTENKLTLSIKELQKKPWDLFLENHKVSDQVEVKVVKKMQYGLLAEIDREVCGVINRQDYSWDPNYNLAGDVEVGTVLTVKITSIDKKNERVSLSKKHLEYNPWSDVKLKKGDQDSATVLRFEENSVVLQVGSVQGTMSFNEVSVEKGRVEDMLKVGDIITCEVLACYPREWKLVLSKKIIEDRKNREVYEEYLKENVSSSTSLGEYFKK